MTAGPPLKEGVPTKSAPGGMVMQTLQYQISPLGGVWKVGRGEEGGKEIKGCLRAVLKGGGGWNSPP
jgi:hypothetical protein